MSLPTPLMDCVLLLLICFVALAHAPAAAPTQSSPVTFDDSVSDANPGTTERDHLRVSIEATDRAVGSEVGYRVAGKVVPSVEAAINELRRLGSSRPVLVRAAPSVPYGPVFRFIAAAIDDGFEVSVGEVSSSGGAS